jgi:nucleotide sugar dehydrogenase
VNVCVVGLGKIGLPLAVQFAHRGHHVLGADINSETVEAVNSGQEPFPGEALLAERLRDAIAAGRFEATTDTVTAVAQSDVVVVVVPLVVDSKSKPEFTALDAATDAIGRGLKPDALVCYETTLPVGTTRNRFVPALEAASGLRSGTDFSVCFSPERVYSGRIFADLRRYPKLVGGVDARATAKAIGFYESALEFDERPDLEAGNGVWDMGSAEAAELAKLAETTYRNINIGFANELARFADSTGIDVLKVIDASNSQPFSHIHRPGVAVGGHCIPVYPRFYLAGDPDAAIPAAACDTNEAMPAYAVELLGELLGSLAGERVLVLGAAYRGGVKETAFSGVFALVEVLTSKGAVALVHDPMYSDNELTELGLTPHHLGDAVGGAIVQTDHVEYRSLTPADLPGVRGLVDGRYVIDPGPFSAAGVTVKPLGRPGA